MAKPNDWLGPFVEHEVSSALAWAIGKHEATFIVKPDPDCRFEDDYSNLRSCADSASLPSGSIVQIARIVFAESRVVAFLTDGHTQIKARLSQDVVRTIEAAIDEKLDLDLKNDLIKLENVTIESTPYGPYDGFVQLVVLSAEYLFHLRKPLGHPQPIEQRPRVAQLLRDIETLRQRQQAIPDEPDEPIVAGAELAPANQQTHSTNVESGANLSRQPKDSPSVPKAALSSQQTQHAFATQVPAQTKRSFLASQILSSRKHAGPDLDQDGFEVKQGLNLALPVAPNMAPSDAPTQPKPDRQKTVSSTEEIAAAHGTSGMLHLLKATNMKRKAAEPVSLPRNPKRRSMSPVVVKQAHVSHAGGHTSPPAAKASPLSTPTRVENIQKTEGHSLAAILSNLAAVASQGKSPKPAPHHSSNETTFEVPRLAPSRSAEAEDDTRPNARARLDYLRRPVPPDQQKLLAKDTSWLPSPPGRIFPRGNVPIGLLSHWNAKYAGVSSTPSNNLDSASIAAENRNALMPRQTEQHESNIVGPTTSSSSSEAESSSSEEEIGESEWPLTPSPKMNRLPPDSTMESTNGQSQERHNSLPSRLSQTSQVPTSSAQQNLPERGLTAVHATKSGDSPSKEAGSPVMSPTVGGQNGGSATRAPVPRSAGLPARPNVPIPKLTDMPPSHGHGLPSLTSQRGPNILKPQLATSPQQGPDSRAPNPREAPHPSQEADSYSSRRTQIGSESRSPGTTKSFGNDQHLVQTPSGPRDPRLARGRSPEFVAKRTSGSLSISRAKPRNPTDTYRPAYEPRSSQEYDWNDSHHGSQSRPYSQDDRRISSQRSDTHYRPSEENRDDVADDRRYDTFPETRRGLSPIRQRFMGPSGNTFKQPHPSPRYGDAVMVRGTQRSPQSSGEMDMSVPRSFGERDPSSVHRQERSNYFRPLQRHAWIEANQTSYTNKADFYKAYQRAWPNDDITTHEFANMMDEVKSTPSQHRSSTVEVAIPASSRHVSPPKLDGAFEAPESVAQAEGPDMSVFTRFAQDWRKLRPGGAFANHSGREASKQTAPALNVLAWEL